MSFRLDPDNDQVGYHRQDTAASLAMGLGSVLWDTLWRLPVLPIYLAIHEWVPWQVTFQWWQFPLILLAQDFLYYWSHRSHHVIRVLWAAHVVHHSSRAFNLSTALRQSWTAGLTTWVFYLPLLIAGVPPAALFFAQGVNLIYQFWVHTERVSTLARPFEFFFNTPSHHRVHHASNGSYLDRNFGGILIVWDRLFGTFEPEGERCEYGLTKNIDTFNPIRIAYHEYGSIAKDLALARTWPERAGFLLKGPGWAAERRQRDT
ncbi:sterol desaturase family protein [Actinokineospora sp. HUAS TT18]|uniref:sterol desaturase family protein n=1 Tax=Actinokineospora sp. HUAS TT18 TaxID=3447451 RepID=UPI003F51E61C